jgi:hypothetical protein
VGAAHIRRIPNHHVKAASDSEHPPGVEKVRAFRLAAGVPYFFKTPLSDIVKPPAAAPKINGGKKRKTGGQKGPKKGDRGVAEAANNPAELTIRQSVLDRIVTQGSRGQGGSEWYARFWSVFTACSMQNVLLAELRL